MRKAFLFLLSIIFIISLVVGFLFVTNYVNGESILNIDIFNEIDNLLGNSSVNEEEVTASGITCFDFIDSQLSADGFTYLEDAKWGRGPYNNFIIDLEQLEFGMIFDTDIMNGNTWGFNVSNWYNEINKYHAFIYNYLDRKVWSASLLLNGYTKNDDVATVNYDAADVDGNFYEFEHWMEYYINQASKYGCSIENLTVDKLNGEYMTVRSSATKEDIVSVFDRMSTDGVTRYFADVHIEGNIEENPRYKELETKEDYLNLDNLENWETVYFVSVLYKDPTKNTFYDDTVGVQESVFKEFVKDVVFTQTTWIEDDRTNDTIGAYFIYIDNPSGDFQSFYKPVSWNGSRLLYSMSRFNSIATPFDGFTMLVNKSQVKSGQVYELQPQTKTGTLKFYLQIINEVNPDFKYSDDFVTNYSRPFNRKWQRDMGLLELFDAKFGLTNKDIKYTW